MSLGYRYLWGLGVKKSCEKALRFYEYAANYAAADMEYRGYNIFADKSNLGDHGRNFKNLLSDIINFVTSFLPGNIGEGHREVDSEIVNYYFHLTEEGDVSAIVSLGWIYLQGSERVDQDIPRALGLFQRASNYGHVSANGQYGFMLMMEAYRATFNDGRGNVILRWLEMTGYSSYSSFVHL